MKEEKRQKLEESGWAVGDADEFLTLDLADPPPMPEVENFEDYMEQNHGYRVIPRGEAKEWIPEGETKGVQVRKGNIPDHLATDWLMYELLCALEGMELDEFTVEFSTEMPEQAFAKKETDRLLINLYWWPNMSWRQKTGLLRKYG